MATFAFIRTLRMNRLTRIIITLTIVEIISLIRVQKSSPRVHVFTTASANPFHRHCSSRSNDAIGGGSATAFISPTVFGVTNRNTFSRNERSIGKERKQHAMNRKNRMILNYRNETNAEVENQTNQKDDCHCNNPDPHFNEIQSLLNNSNNEANKNYEDEHDDAIQSSSGKLSKDNSELIFTEKQLDYVGAGTLGDIMSEDATTTSSMSNKNNTNDNINQDVPTENTPKSGLVTSTGGTLQAQFGHKISNLSPLDRIALTANGNLQRIFSSYYDAPVHVYVDSCEKTIQNGQQQSLEEDMTSSSIWHRKVHLSVFGQIFCTAKSTITVHSSECRELIESGEVGIGQLFRYLDILPKFTIIDAGRNQENGKLWRHYILQCKELTCNIHEEFSVNAWNIHPRDDSFGHHDSNDNQSTL